MRVVLLRHASTNDHEKGFHQRPTSRLSPTGEEQARLVAERLKGERFDKVFVSPFTRTTQTWEAIAQHHPTLSAHFLSEIQEISKGAYEGLPHGTLLRDILKAGLPFGHFRPEHGESLRDAEERILGFWKQLKNEEGNILVVSHGGLLSLLILHLMGLPLDRKGYDSFHPKNTAVTVIEWENGRARIPTLNCTRHLTS